MLTARGEPRDLTAGGASHRKSGESAHYHLCFGLASAAMFSTGKEDKVKARPLRVCLAPILFWGTVLCTAMEGPTFRRCVKFWQSSRRSPEIEARLGSGAGLARLGLPSSSEARPSVRRFSSLGFHSQGLNDGRGKKLKLLCPSPSPPSPRFLRFELCWNQYQCGLTILLR
ncbi:uncharacterized protein ACOB8E_014991 isoform 3-T6 [Sarcophilus harrisii]